MKVANNPVGMFQKIIHLYEDQLWGPSNLLSSVLPGEDLSPGVMWKGFETNNSPLSGAKIKNARSYTSAPSSSSFLCSCLSTGTNLPFTGMAHVTKYCRSLSVDQFFTVSRATLCSIKFIHFERLKVHHHMFRPMLSSSCVKVIGRANCSLLLLLML